MMLQWFEQLKRLSFRERVMVLAGGLFLVTVLIYITAVEPMLDRMQRLDRLIAGKQSAIQELAVIRAEYVGVHARATQIDQRIDAASDTFSLLAFLEEVATDAHIKSQIVSMRPQSALPSNDYRENSVEVKIEKVALSSVVDLLRAMHEASAVLRFKRLHLRPRFDNPAYLDVAFLVSTYERI